MCERRFILRGRADRVEQHPDGLILLDYKTGQVATEKQVRIGLAPQLTLLAAMLRQGKFAGVPAGAVRSVGYVQLKGGETPGEELPIKFKEGAPDQQAEKALRRLTELIERFEDESTPYRSLVHPMWSTRYGDYDHLARVREWSILADDPLAALV